MDSINNHQVTDEDLLLPSFQMMDDASLPHIQLNLPTNVQISAVVDSGASHCYLGRDLFHTIDKHETYVKRSLKIKVQTGNGKINCIANLACIPTVLKTHRGQPITYNIPFLVVDFLGHEAYIGVSILFKRGWFRRLTGKYLYTDRKINRKVKIQWINATTSAKLMTSVDIQLLPHESTIVPTHPNKPIEKDQDHVISNYIPHREENMEKYNIYSIIPQISNYCENNFYNLILKNNSDEPIAIPKNTPVGVIQSMQHQQLFNTIAELQTTNDDIDHRPNDDIDHRPHSNTRSNTLLQMTTKRTLAPHASTHPSDEPIEEHILAKSEYQLRSEEAVLGKQQKTTIKGKSEQTNNKPIMQITSADKLA